MEKGIKTILLVDQINRVASYSRKGEYHEFENMSP